jgi:hypothetical protein
MKRYWGHIFAGALLLAGSGALIPACVHDDSTIFIRSVLAPPQSSGTAGCMYTADPTQPTLSIGELDVGLASRYVTVLLVGNQMTPQGDPVQARTETSRVEIQGAIVTVTDANGNQLSSYTTATSQTVDPASGSSPSYSVMAVIAVDAATIASFAGNPNSRALPSQDAVVTPNSQQQIISNIQVFGHTLGGESVQSNVFQFPIELCIGCLVGGIAGNACASLSMPTTTTTVPCQTGQDQPIDCSLCQEDQVCQCGMASCNGSTPEGTPDGGAD